MFRPLMLAALLAASSAQAGKPRAVGTNSPEVVYTLATAKGYELRVANEDGTGAVTLYKASGITIGKFGPRADRTIAVYAGNDMYLLTYRTSPTGVMEEDGTRRWLFNNGRANGAPSPFDFNGTHIAWWHPETGDLRIFDVVAGTDDVLLNVPNLSGVSFSADGTEIFYADGGESGPYLLQRISIAGGEPTAVGVDTNVGTFDSGHQTDAFAIAGPSSGRWMLTYVPAGATSGEAVAQAIEASFRCDDTMIIYRKPMSNNSYDLMVYDVAAKKDSAIFSTNNNAKFASYMPDCDQTAAAP